MRLHLAGCSCKERRKSKNARRRKKEECEATMIRPQKIIRGGPRDSLAVWKDIISHLLPVQKGSLEVERMDGSRPERVQEVQTALLEGEREREKVCWKIMTSTLPAWKLTLPVLRCSSNKSNITEAGEAYSLVWYWKFVAWLLSCDIIESVTREVLWGNFIST